ncbi:MAG TPA: AAA family ATPase [Acidimicrobiia bacterium]|jgi:pilus assembly protein CpaE|nr:AAA family ATPase [Acidimicrobiia bacterium]
MSLAEHNLLVVDQDDDFVASAKQLFDGSLPVARTLEEASQTVASGDVRMVLIGPSYGSDEAMEQIRQLHNQDPSLVLMMVAEEVTADLLRKGMRAGVSDVLEAPLDEAKIEAAIEQFAHDVLRRQSTAPAAAKPEERPRRSEGRIITVTSAKGGSGKTVLATNLALVLNRIPDVKVCLVDADLQFGDVCLVLQLEPRFTMVNAAHELHHLDAELLDSLLTEHPTGLKVLAAPLEPAFADDITTAGLMQMLDVLKENYDYVIVDTAAMLDELILSLIEKSDDILMLVDMDLPSVKNAKLALETLRLLKFSTANVQLVMNRSNSKAKLDNKEIEGALKMEISASIPSDAVVAASVNEGRPVVETDPKSRVAKGFESVAELIAGKIPEAQGKSGLFGRK